MKKFCKILSALTACLILVTAFPREFGRAETVSQTAQKRTVNISDADEFIKFAEECSLDSYSRELRVELQADINLSGKDFFGVPIFCGTFNGNGHLISGLYIRDSASETGLFRHVERGAVVKNLRVSGSVCPGGSANMAGGIVGVNLGTVISCEFGGTVSGNDSIGGIVGKNGESGFINSCKSTANVSAESAAGGVVGMNLGTILDCSNSGNVNAVYTDTEITADDLGLQDKSVETVISKSDIGGVAGYSSGILRRCSNSGTVGYQHTGYNIGGVVGRQCGLLENCVNSGEIFGRKDVGGIAGQMEPYRSIEFSEDSAQRLGNEMNNLSDGVDKLVNDARVSGDKLDSEIQTLTSHLSSAQKNADIITNRAEDIFGGYSDGINELLARADSALDKMPGAMNDLDKAVELIGEFSGKCAEALDELKNSGEYGGEAVDAANEALKDIDKSLPELQSALRGLSQAMTEIQNALGDPEEIKTALSGITTSLDKISDKMGVISNAAKRLNDALSELSDGELRDLQTSVSAFSDSLSDVLAALGDVSGAVGDISAAIDSGEMQSALSELNSATAALGRAAAKLSSAVGTVPDRGDLSAAADELKDAADSLQNAANHLNTAVDPDGMSAALGELQTSAKELSSALDRASAAAGDMSSALQKVNSSESVDTAREQLDIILNSLSDMSADLADINENIRVILDNIDASGLAAAMKTLSGAIDDIASAAGEIKLSGDNIDKASDALQKTVDSLASAASKAEDAAKIMSSVSDSLSLAVRQFEDIANELSGKPEIRFPALDETFTNAADSLSGNMQGMISSLSRLSEKAKTEGNVLLDDIDAINDCLSRIFGIFKESYKDLLSDEEEQRGFSEDISENENADSRHGKAYACVNHGTVAGDVNVGGITGAMAIEFDLDPEDDITLNGDRSINFSYNVMDVIESCENEGEITAKKNYCGGIVGRMDMGLVKNAHASGKISSTGGNYIGGIAGYSSAKIRMCLAKVTLSGLAYIGGIAGEGGIITDCAAISDITDFTEKIGAVAGYVDFAKENAEIKNNFFVDRGTAGIDRVSYAGIAEPFDYEKFAALAGEFSDIILEFTADGVSLGKIKVPFGGSVKLSDIPEIPQKSGYFARWEEFDFENITFPRVLCAEYVELLSSIACENLSEKGLPLVLADGNFDDSAQLLVDTESSSIFAPENCELRIVTVNGSAPNALRFLKPSGSSKLMQYINGAWKPVEYTENGSYLIVENPVLDNGTAAFCVSSQTASVLPVILAAAAVIGIAVAVIVLVKLKSRKKQMTK